MSAPSTHPWPQKQRQLPKARVLKKGARSVPPALGEDVRSLVTPSERTRVAFAYFVGLWPLVLIMGAVVALLWSAGYQQP